MSKMILIGLVVSLLTADSMEDLSAVDIADQMIAANTRTAFNLEGRFLCVTRDRLRDGGQATIALYEKTLNDSTQSSHREQVASPTRSSERGLQRRICRTKPGVLRHLRVADPVLLFARNWTCRSSR